MKIYNKEYSPRKSETSTVGEAINALLKSYKIQDKFNEKNLIASWGKLMGPAIAIRTEEIYISRKKLYITLNSAPLKNELSFQKLRLMEMLKEEFGENVIEEIIIR